MKQIAYSKFIGLIGIGMIAFFGTSQNTYLKTIGTSISDYGTSCIPMPDLGTVTTVSGGMLVGSGIQFGLVKTDYNGFIEWQKLYSNGTFALARNVVRTLDGGLCTFGEVRQSANTNNALFILKTDANGNELWSYRIEASASDRATNLIACVSGGFLSCSIGNYNTGGYPVAQLVRYAENGTILWAKKYSVFQGVSPASMIELSNGDFAFVSSVNTAFTGVFKHVLLSRVNAQGNLIWSKMFYGDYDDEPHDLVETPQGELYIVGASYRIESNWDGFILKTDASGTLIKNVYYDANTSNGEYFRNVTLVKTGGLAVLGDLGSFDQRNVSLLKVTHTGQVVWAHDYPLSTAFTNYGSDVYETYDEGFLITGDVRPPTYVRDAALIKTDVEGVVSCYTDHLSYTQAEVLINEMPVYMTQVEDEQLPHEVILFTHPPDQITVKVVCENLLPIVKTSNTQTTSCPHVCVDFTDGTLSNPTQWFWEFDGGFPSTSTEQHPNVCYSAPGNYTVKLTVSNAVGSVAKLEMIYISEFDCPLPEIPNVFTPNKDGVNDLFEFPVFSEKSILYIYNRWGILVYKNEGVKLSWDGKTQQGLEATDGVYFYLLESMGKKKNGFLHLQR